MHRIVTLTIFLAFAVLTQGGAFGQFSFQQSAEGVEASLVAENATVAPGATFSVGILLEHTDDWHTYWQNPGTGAPTTVSWDLPQGFQAGEIQWPVPEVVFFSFTVTYAYHDEVLLIVDITAPDDLPPGSNIELKANVKWLQCKEVCQPGSAEVSLSLPVASESTPAPSNTDLFAAARERQPKTPEAWDITAKAGDGDALSLILRPTSDRAAELAEGEVYFFPYGSLTDKQIVEEQTQPLKKLASGDGYEISLKRAEDAGGLEKLSGVLWSAGGWQDGGSPVALLVEAPLGDGEVTSAGVPAVPASSVPGGLAKIIAFAFIGGLILNLMPCVFPIIGIKIMGFVNQAGEDTRKVTMHGIVFTVGILISFWVLAALLFALRAAGDSLNWGFPLPEPIFVYVLTLLLVFFALTLLGFFDFGTSPIGVCYGLIARPFFAGSFFSGVLAVVVATPCSAPFLATALGAVLTLPIAQSFVVFTAMGLGLALPYLILSAFPKLVNLLPRPGAWMETFKKVMAFPLLATVAYLIWIYGGQVDASILLNCLLALVLLAFALWIYGGWSVPSRPKRTRTIATVSMVVMSLAGLALGYPQRPSEDDLVWEAWSPESVAALRDEGRPVYIDFTARWCATCQTNKLAYTSAAVRAAFNDRNFALLKADLTQENPTISRALESYGKNAIPVNVAYLPGEDSPRILPEILTPDVVLKAIN
ncbi:thioredoxin family protein [soil metagenome]